MDTERFIAAAVLAIGCLPLAMAFTRRKPRELRLVAVLLAILLPVAFAWPLQWIPRPVRESEVLGRPIQVEQTPYVSSDKCRSCHPREYSTWHASFHRVMTRIATPEDVVGKFDGQEESLLGTTYRLGRDGDSYWVEMLDPDQTSGQGPPRRVRKEIVMTTGRHHIQVYWYSSGEGRKLTLVPIVYLVKDERWVPRQSSFLRPPQTGMVIDVGRWNTSCIQCHTTAGESRATDSGFDSHLAEFGIACESCHGPAYEHVTTNHNPLHRYRQHLGAETDTEIVDPADLPADRASQLCGQCHSAWSGHHENPEGSPDSTGTAETRRYRPGDDLDSQRHFISTQVEAAKFKAAGAFWPDGMIRVAGREYNGLLQSACFNHGDPEKVRLSCLSCHEMHPTFEESLSVDEWRDDQLKAGMRGNEACLQCHESYRDRLEEHTHHSPNSAGSLCYDCHMNHTAYGLLKAVRSHTIETPSVATSVQIGRPNACNQCHLDKTLEWAAGHLKDWFGQAMPRLDADQRNIAASVIWTLKGDAAQRALMAWSFGWNPAQKVSGTDWMLIYLVELMNDPYDAVRYMAYRSLRTLPGYKNIDYDFLSTVSERGTVQQKVEQIWMRRPSQELPSEELLFTPDGRFRTDEFQRLQQMRDQNPIIIVE